MARPAGGLEVTWAVMRRPHLWSTALVLGLRLGRWGRWPPRPLPPADYVEFRLTTMYGDAPVLRMRGEEAVAYLEWCRRMRDIAR